jgi:hypothetical protein
MTYPTFGYMDRYCLPDPDDDLLDEALDEVNDEIDLDTLSKWLNDCANTWEVMLMVAGITIVVAAIYLMFLRFCLGVVIWTSIVFILVALCCFGYFLLWTREN